MRLQGKVAIVTGAGRGNGKAMAIGLAREGARVVIADYDGDTARETARSLVDSGAEAIAVRVDISKRAAVEGLVDQTVRRFGCIDILVANAGVTSRFEFLDLPEEEFDRVIAVNLKGVFLCGQAVARKMAEQGGGGSIINLSSVNSMIAKSNTAHYCASKGGVRLLTQAMALSLARYGIRVNAIGPGTIETDMNTDWRSQPEAVAAAMARTPIGRFGRPEDLVGAAVFLASDESSYVTGTTIFVDGGRLAG